jgi:hypothetical protein
MYAVLARMRGRRGGGMNWIKNWSVRYKIGALVGLAFTALELVSTLAVP